MKSVPAILLFYVLGIVGLLTNADDAKINGTNLHMANIVSAVALIVAVVLTAFRLVERNREAREITDYDDEPDYRHSGLRR